MKKHGVSGFTGGCLVLTMLVSAMGFGLTCDAQDQSCANPHSPPKKIYSWDETAFKNLWQVFFEHDPNIQFVGRKLGALKSAAFKQWLSELGDDFGQQEPTSIQLACQRLQALKSGNKNEKKAVFSQTETIALAQMSLNAESELETNFKDYLGDVPGKKAAAKEYLSTKTSPEALQALDADIAQNRVDHPTIPPTPIK